MNAALVHITVLALIGCAVAQNNGLFSTGFLGNNNNPSRLASARLLQSARSTTEQPQFEEQYYEEKPSSLRAGFKFNQPQDPPVPPRPTIFQGAQPVQETNLYKDDTVAPVQPQAPVRIGTPIISHSSPEERVKNEKERLEQNRSAKYAFNSVVSDTIFDNSHVREEVRDGLKLAGLYSYSDGFYKRTVHYVADENGYRVVKEDVEPIGGGEGPLLNPNGEIDVASNYDGAAHNYHATAKDIPSLFRPQEPAPAPSKLLSSPINIRQQ